MNRALQILGIILAAIAIPLSAEIDGCKDVAMDDNQETQSIFDDKSTLETGDNKQRVLTKEEPKEIKTKYRQRKGGNP